MKALFTDEATTQGVVVRVSVSYLPEQSEPHRGRWFWAYHIRIENDGAQGVQLLTRHWIITDGRGLRHFCWLACPARERESPSSPASAPVHCCNYY